MNILCVFLFENDKNNRLIENDKSHLPNITAIFCPSLSVALCRVNKLQTLTYLYLLFCTENKTWPLEKKMK